MGENDSYPPVHVVLLRLLIEITVCSSSVDHAAAHWDGSSHDMVNQLWLASMAHGIDAALRESQVNGFGEIEWCRRGISEI